MRAQDAHPDDPLLLACRQIARAMDLFDEQATRVLGLGRSDLRALNLLEHGPLSAAALADRLGLTRTAITALVDRLVAAGYASRHPDASDRRSISIQLEPATWQAFAEIYRPLGQRVQAATHHLEQRDRDVVIAALSTMTQAFDAARGDSTQPHGE